MSGEPVIRPYRASDAADLYAAALESHHDMSTWMPWCHEEYTLEEAATWIELTLQGRREHTLYDFAITHQDKFCGACGINSINHQDQVGNLGYWIRSGATGQGLAHRAAQQVIRWAFANTALNRLDVVIAQGNLRSQRVAEKLGLTAEALLQKRVLVNGVSSSAFLYAALRGDTKQEQGT